MAARAAPAQSSDGSCGMLRALYKRMLEAYALLLVTLWLLFPVFAIVIGVMAYTEATELTSGTWGFGTEDFIAARGKLCDPIDLWSEMLVWCQWFGGCLAVSGCSFLLGMLLLRCAASSGAGMEVVGSQESGMEFVGILALLAWLISYPLVSLIP